MKTRGGVYGQRGGLVRAVYLAGALVVWCATLGGRRRTGGVVLCYHGVSDAQKEMLARHVRIAAKRAVRLSQVSARPRGVCFTFDDAFANLLRNALPVMAGHGVPSVVFAVSENLGEAPKWEMREGHPERDERIMTGGELREAEGFEGCRVQSHTATHARLGERSEAEATEELRRSRMELAGIVGHTVDAIAAPYGSWTPGVVEAAKGLGYQWFLTLDPLDGREAGGVLVGRYLMTPETSPIEFRLTIDGAYEWVFAARRMARRMKRVMTGRGQRTGGAGGAVAESAA